MTGKVGGPMTGASASSVEGVHRWARPWLRLLWVFLVIAFGLTAAGAWSNGDVAVAVVESMLFAGGLVMLWRLRFEGTTVSAQGLRVTRLGSRELSWTEVASVDEPDRWSDPPTLRVRTTSGAVVFTHIPSSMYDEFVAYAAAHGSTAGSGTQNGEPSHNPRPGEND